MIWDIVARTIGEVAMIVEAPKQRAGKSQTIERAALILACFSAEEPHLTLAELASRLNLNQSTAYRYVSTLQDAGLLERDQRRGGYRLGLRVIELSYVALNHIDVRKHALDEMDKLRDEFNLLVSLGVLFEGDVLHIAHSVPAHWPPWYTTVGRRAVAHCTSLGKVLLAALPWPAALATVERFGWRPYTPKSIQDPERLERELALVRERGVAIDDEERNLGTMCVGAPVRDYSGQVVAALSVSGKLERLAGPDRDAVVGRVREAADRVSLRLGYGGTSAYL
jgi:DNA-binding IclR family transcriptional regulator